MTSVTIPNSVTSIGSYAFRFCSSLTSVTVGWETPFGINSYTFYNSQANATLYVPYGARIQIVFGNVTTGISQLSGVQSASGEYYDLQGRRVLAPARGVYMKDGKKIIVK